MPSASADGRHGTEPVQEALLGIAETATRQRSGSTGQALLVEVIVLRTIILDLVYDVANGEPMTRERMQERTPTACRVKVTRNARW